MSRPAWRCIVEHRGFALVDGGLASELERRGYRLDTALWSAELLSSNQQAIAGAHGDFLAAGADVVITATYQASIEGFAARGIGEHEARRLMRLAVDLARDACDRWRTARTNRGGPLVAASVGPFGAALADGSEYRGDYGVEDARLRVFHSERLAFLEASGADLLAVETIPSAPEARVIADLLGERSGPDAWISFSCRDGACLNDGTPIELVASELNGHPRIGAIGVNCTHPDYVESLIGRIAETAPDKDIVVYPNLGEHWNAHTREWEAGSGAVRFEVLAERWYRAGARLIGGCCRTTPGIIAAVGRRLDALQPTRNET